MELVEIGFNRSELTHLYEFSKTDLITDFQRHFIVLTVAVFASGIISIFGCTTNIMNMIIFYKQGLDTTINISFFSIAISDLGSLVFRQLGNVYFNPLFVDLNFPIMHHEFQYFTTAILSELFAKITCLLTVYVTAERCICIAFPLHVKQMITPRRTRIVIICIYVTMLFSGSPAFGITYISWNYYPKVNKTLLGLVYRKNTKIADGIVYLIHAILGILAFATMVLLTSVLIYYLDRKGTFMKTAFDMGKTQIISNRDKATMIMVVLIASILIVCFFPSVVLFSVTIFEPEFAIGGMYNNLFTTLWSLAVFLENINSSVNIFFYYKMSTRYRKTFRIVFCKHNQSRELRDDFNAKNTQQRIE